MSQRVYPVGTSQVPLVVTVDDDGPVSGVPITAKIIAPWAGTQFDFSDNVFKAVASVVQPTVVMTESLDHPGVYFSLWNTSNIVSEADVVAIYEATGTNSFIEDESFTFTTPGDADTIASSFSETVYDAATKTLTVIAGIKNAAAGILPSTQAAMTIKDELGQTLLAKTTTSTNGLHRAVFPNVTFNPNRILLLFITFTVGAGTFDTVEPITVLGMAS
jgi:hypothetical protein